MISSSGKYLSLSELLGWRAEQRGVVFTNGVFDILHKGHVSLLETARAQGEKLVVALNDDSSAARLEKGVGRPFNTLEDRLEVVAALEAVDRVTSFSEDTPEELIKAIKPDVLVKGGDYRGKKVPGQDTVNELGGKVVLVNFLEGYSTTDIVRRISGA